MLKSRNCIEIWLTIYDDCEGLESFTREPIGYSGVLDLYGYVLNRPLGILDPSGLDVACRGLEHVQGISLITVPTKDAIPGMPWTSGNLNGPGFPKDKINLGLTTPTFSGDCNCVKCCNKLYLGEIALDLKFKITIDENAHKNAGFGYPWVDSNTTSVEGTYGHEQRHVFLGVSVAEAWAANSGINFDENFGEGDEGQQKCKQKCADLMLKIRRELRKLVTDAMSHNNGLPEGSPQPPIGTMPRRPRN
jgi:hypothetical protein